MDKIKEEFIFSENNFFNEKYIKKQIVIGNTLYSDMQHIDIWKKKVYGKYKGIAAYTIRPDGSIYNHYNPEYYTNFIKISDYDKFIIPIVLENVGWLIKNFNDDSFINWCGERFNGNEGDIVNVKWRGKMRWAPYTDKQLVSLSELTINLAKNFDIPLNVSGHNTKIGDIQEKEGIYYKSNYSKKYLDVSPAFDFTEFKNKIEKNGKFE